MAHALDSAEFAARGLSHQMRTDLLTYQNRTRKVLPNCASPPASGESTDLYHTDDQKREIILKDPKFGMFSLYKYHVTRGYNNDALREKNAMYCSHIFSYICCVPILVVISQWMMFVALLVHKAERYDRGFCPNDAPVTQKVIMSGVSLMYFTRSFFLWDSMIDRTRLHKMVPVVDVWVILDTFMEFAFSIAVIVANIWLVFIEDSATDMLLNSMAMEFLMALDNEYEALYFEYLPESACDIYDNVFVTHRENRKMVTDRLRESRCFRVTRCVSWLPFKLLMICTALFPLLTFAFVFVGGVCK